MFTKKVQPFFWLAIIAHLLLFISLSISLFFDPPQAFEKKSTEYLPTYLYSQDASPAQSPAHPAAARQPALEKTLPSSEKIALQKKQPPPLKQQQQPLPDPSASRPKTAGSSGFIEATSPTTGKPLDEPLLKELSRATAEKLFYPPQAAVFNLKGTAIISFSLYPDGRVTAVTVAKSSGFRVLDEAAVAAIRAISPVRDANLYLTKPKIVLAGIIYG